MPSFVTPNSFGSDLTEVWSDAARAASIAARQRRAQVKALQVQRSAVTGSLLNLVRTYGHANAPSAKQAWTQVYDLTGQIQHLQRQRVERPLLSRLRRAFRRRAA